MPDILRIMTRQRFLRLHLANKFEPSGCIDFHHDFPQSASIENLKEFLQPRIYQRVAKIQIYLRNQSGELSELADHLRIDQLPLGSGASGTLVYAYDLPEPFIRAMH